MTTHNWAKIAKEAATSLVKEQPDPDSYEAEAIEENIAVVSRILEKTYPKTEGMSPEQTAKTVAKAVETGLKAAANDPNVKEVGPPLFSENAVQAVIDKYPDYPKNAAVLASKAVMEIKTREQNNGLASLSSELLKEATAGANYPCQDCEQTSPVTVAGNNKGLQIS